MSDMESPRPSRRPKRAFTTEFKAGAVRLVLDEGQPIHRVARQLDLGPTTLGEWVKRARGPASGRIGNLSTESDNAHRGHAERAVQRHVHQLEALGSQVTIEKAA